MRNTIDVYQSLDLKEKVTNQSAHPALVYSRITTLSLILRQIEKEGTGIILCRHSSMAVAIQNSIGRNNVAVMDILQLKCASHIDRSKLFIVMLKGEEPVKISELHQIASAITMSGIVLKWITILQEPGFNQLFKWELKYN